MAKAMFEQIFDGPDSVFGQIFGPSREKLRQERRAAKRTAKKPKPIRVTMTKAQLQKLGRGEELTFDAGAFGSVIVRMQVQ